MSPLVIKILIQIMMKFGAPITWTIVKVLYKSLKKHYESATPEQQAEWKKDWAKDFQPGEGKLPDTPGIVVENAMNPKEHVDDKVGE